MGLFARGNATSCTGVVLHEGLDVFGKPERKHPGKHAIQRMLSPLFPRQYGEQPSRRETVGQGRRGKGLRLTRGPAPPR